MNVEFSPCHFFFENHPITSFNVNSSPRVSSAAIGPVRKKEIKCRSPYGYTLLSRLTLVTCSRALHT